MVAAGLRAGSSGTPPDVATITRRVGRLLLRRGLVDDGVTIEPLATESHARVASAAVQGRVALGPRAGARVERLGSDPDAPWVESSRPLQARCDGFDLHGAVAVAGEDKVSSLSDTVSAHP